MSKVTKLRLFGGAVLLFNLWLVGRYDLKGLPALVLTLGFAIGYELIVVRTLAPAPEPASRKMHWLLISAAGLVPVAMFVTALTLNDRLGSAARGPSPTRSEAMFKEQPTTPNIAPLPDGFVLEDPTAPGATNVPGWTQESTGSAQEGPWLDYSPRGTRYFRDANGIIHRAFPPGTRPDAAPVDASLLAKSTNVVPPE